jgi:hypothetical protein
MCCQPGQALFPSQRRSQSLRQPLGHPFELGALLRKFGTPRLLFGNPPRPLGVPLSQLGRPVSQAARFSFDAMGHPGVAATCDKRHNLS